METSLIEIIKLAFIIATPLATICWHLYRKVELRQDKFEDKFDLRIENQNNKMSELEKALLEMRAEFRYTSRDIKEMREILEKMYKRSPREQI